MSVRSNSAKAAKMWKTKLTVAGGGIDGLSDALKPQRPKASSFSTDSIRRLTKGAKPIQSQDDQRVVLPKRFE